MKRLMILVMILLLCACSNNDYDRTSKVVSCMIEYEDTIYDNFSVEIKEVKVNRMEEHIFTIEEGIIKKWDTKSYIPESEIVKYHASTVEEYYQTRKAIIDNYESGNETGPSNVEYYDEGIILTYTIDLSDMSDYYDDYLKDERTKDGVVFEWFEKAYFPNGGCKIVQ